MIHAFPKIFAVGQDYIRDLFSGDVEISEKIDGSQFNWGKVNGELYLRSKGKIMFKEAPEKMFQEAIDYVLSIEDQLPDNMVFYSEYLRIPKHNVLSYSRVPKNHLILFGVSTVGGTFISDYDKLVDIADSIDLETVPLIYKGKIDKPEKLLEMLETQSVLGNTTVEGVVVKNYNNPFLLGGQPIPIMMGKFVSEKFKEVHRDTWNKEFKAKNRWIAFCEGFRTEARWLKAVQHLEETGELEHAPRDIGKLIKEINRDIGEEEKENIKEVLWQEFGKEIFRKSTAGFPEWYKEQLMVKQFDEERGESDGHGNN